MNPHPAQAEHPLSTTADLITRAKAGDEAARAEILSRYREPLLRFLHGRLSPAARGVLDTNDVVQETLLALLGRIGAFEYRGLGSLWIYLRRIGINLLLKEEHRRGIRGDEVKGSAHLRVAADGSGPSSALERREAMEAFEQALENVPERAREALLLRLELGLPYEVLARECGYPSPDAARMAIGRTMDGLAKELRAFEP